MIKIRVEINKIDIGKSIRENQGNQDFFFLINRSDKLLAELSRKKDSPDIRDERRDISTNFTEIKRIISEYGKQLWINKLDYLD